MYSRCDVVGLNGKPEYVGPCGSYTHAQKMRASSMTHMFGRVHRGGIQVGSLSWRPHDGDARPEGNPSISEKVSTYMVQVSSLTLEQGLI